MKSNYQERKENRLEAYQNLASKNEQLADNLFQQSDKMASVIPMGQPILVGHHSEKSDRNYRAKIHNKMVQGIEASKKAKYYAGKVESLLSNKSISSDDPNAIDKLTEKLERLEGLQELMKDANKIIKGKKLSQVEKVALLVEMGFNERRAIILFEPDFCGRIGFADYQITNNGATIRATKQRIEHLGKMQAIESSEEEINGVRFVISSEDNRVQLFFPSIPSEYTRKQLKGYGFHWSPSVGAWMRQISNQAIWSAKQVLASL